MLLWFTLTRARINSTTTLSQVIIKYERKYYVPRAYINNINI